MQFFVRKPSDRMSNFWMVRFLKTESEPNFGFAALLQTLMSDLLCQGGYVFCLSVSVCEQDYLKRCRNCAEFFGGTTTFYGLICPDCCWFEIYYLVIVA